MLRYLFWRLLLMTLTLLGITLVSFVLIHLAPGGPVEQRLQALYSLDHTSSNLFEDPYLEAIKEQYGYDQPILTRYFHWLCKLAEFDFGRSEVFKAPVKEVVWRHSLMTWSSVVIALPVCYLLSFLWSVSWRLQKRMSVRTAQSFLTSLLYTLPSMIIALSLKYLLDLDSQVLVIVSYVLVHMPMMIFLFEGALAQEQSKPYVQVAKAKGLSERLILIKHILRNSLIPVVSSLSYSLLAFFSGSLFIEIVFDVSGLGSLAYIASTSRDYNVLMAILLCISLLFLSAKLLADVLYGVVDPRVRLN